MIMLSHMNVLESAIFPTGWHYLGFCISQRYIANILRHCVINSTTLRSCLRDVINTT